MIKKYKSILAWKERNGLNIRIPCEESPGFEFKYFIDAIEDHVIWVFAAKHGYFEYQNGEFHFKKNINDLSRLTRETLQVRGWNPNPTP